MRNISDDNILIFARTMDIGGAEKIILQVCNALIPLVNSILVCSCGGINVEKLKAMGVEHQMIPDIEKKSLSNIIKIIAILRREIRNRNITIIHAHHRMASFYIEMLGLYQKCECITTCHNCYYDKKILTRFSYKHTNLIACGESVKNNLTNFFKISPERITVIRNAVPPYEEKIIYDPVIQKLRNMNAFVIANVGRLSKQKGFLYYIKAIPLVIKRHPETKFLIIGTGEDEKKLKNIAKNLRENLFFIGYRYDVQNIMSQVDLIVLSSLWEGLPLTPIEAFSVGKTIVATNIEATSEIVQNYRNGLLVEPKNSRELAEKIIWIIEHPEEKTIMEMEAFKDYNEKFSYKIFSKSYAIYYMNLQN